MSSKFAGKWILTTLPALLAFSLIGCDLKLNETPPAPEVKEFKTAECLSNTVPSISAFFKGTASDAEVGATWDCVGTAVYQFRKYVRSGTSDRFTPQEMATFLEQNFLKNDGRRIGPGLQTEVMKIKRVLVGGTIDIITLSELERLIDLTATLRRHSLGLNPFMKIFSQNWQPLEPLSSDENSRYFESGNAQIQSVAAQLAGLDLQSYKMSDAISLVRELGAFMDSDEARKVLEKYIPIVRKLKKAVAGGDEDMIQAREWKGFLNLGARGYVQYLRYNYFIKPSENQSGEVRLNFIARTVEDTISLMEGLVSEKPSQQITDAELNEVLVEISKIWPDFKVSNKLVPEVMKVKQALFGGTLTSVSAADLKNASPKVSVVRSLVSGILPYYSLYAGDWKPDRQDETTSAKFFTSAQGILLSSLRQAGGLFESDYDLNDLPKLVHEVMSIYPELPSANSDWEGSVRKYVPVVVQAKQLVFGDGDSIMRKAQWMPFLPLLGGAYADYLYYDYFHVGGGLGDEKNLNFIESLGQQALATIADVLRAKSNHEISNGEISDLLDAVSKAWPGFKTSDKLVAEVMKLKPFLFGGMDSKLTADDVGTAQGKLGALKAVVSKLAPYLDVYTQDWKREGLSSEKAEAFFVEAKTALGGGLQDLAALTVSPYDLTRLQPLVHEILDLYPQWVQDPKGFEKSIGKYAPLVSDLKNMIFGENDALLRPSTLPSLLSLGGDAYAAYLEEIYFIKDQGATQLSSLQRLDKFVGGLATWGSNVLKTKKTHVFTIAEIKRVIDRVVPLGILPDAFDAATLKPLVSVVVNRLLTSPEQRIIGNLPQVLDQRSLDLALYEWKTWIDLEQFTASLFPNGGETYSAARAKKAYADKYKQVGLSPTLNTGLKETIMALDTPIPMALDDRQRLIVEDRSRPYNRASLGQVNMDRTIARIFLRAYVNDLSRLRTYAGVNLSESQTAFKELKPMAVSLGLIDPDNTTFASSRFREANMFVARANGDSLVSFQEGVDLVSMIWSGLNIHSLFKEDLQKSCLSGRRSKIKSDTLIDRDCMAAVYYRRMASYMSSMPYFAGFIQGISESERAAYFENVLKSAGYIPNAANQVKMGDASLFPHVVQYIEMAYTRFDHNRDWVFSTQEALDAFPCFRNIIAQLAKGQVGEDEYDDIFTYILKNGKPPETIPEKIKYATSWRNKPDTWNLQTDRVMLAKILGYIADQMAKQ